MEEIVEATVMAASCVKVAAQGKSHTGYYQNCKDLSEEDCNTTIYARK